MIAREIERRFLVRFTQSQVSRAAKPVDDWLRSIKADTPGRRARRSFAVGTRQNEPGAPETGKNPAQKNADDQNDWLCETSIIS
jgi:hypothetical protein